MPVKNEATCVEDVQAFLAAQHSQILRIDGTTDAGSTNIRFRLVLYQDVIKEGTLEADSSSQIVR